MQYVRVRFAPEDARTYTYHNSGDRMSVGDWGFVLTRGREKRVEIVEVDVDVGEYRGRTVEIKPAPPPTETDEQEELF